MSWSPQSTLPFSSTDADAIGVAVVGDAQVGARRAHRGRSGPRGSSRTVGSGWWLGKRPSISQKSGTTSKPIAPEERHRDDAAGAVAGVDDDLQPAGGRASDVCRTKCQVGRDDVVGVDLAGMPVCEVAAPRCSRRSAWISSPWSVVFPTPDLEAVVLGRVVAAGDHRQAVHRQRGGGEVGERRGDHADVESRRRRWRRARRSSPVAEARARSRGSRARPPRCRPPLLRAPRCRAPGPAAPPPPR